MLNFFHEILMLGQIETKTTTIEVIFTIIITAILGLLIGITYKKTYKGRYYSQSFSQTLIIVCVVISVIIIVIGSNIARAFSLAGALAIIRFRIAIRDPKDVAFIFFSMGVGLTTGSGLIIPGIAFALVVCGIIYLLFSFNVMAKDTRHKQLKITLPENLNYEGFFEEILEKYLLHFSLVSIRTISLGTMFELVYSIEVKPGSSEKMLIDEIRARNGNLSVAILLEEQFFL